MLQYYQNFELSPLRWSICTDEPRIKKRFPPNHSITKRNSGDGSTRTHWNLVKIKNLWVWSPLLTAPCTVCAPLKPVCLHQTNLFQTIFCLVPLLLTATYTGALHTRREVFQNDTSFGAPTIFGSVQCVPNKCLAEKDSVKSPRCLWNRSGSVRRRI